MNMVIEFDRERDDKVFITKHFPVQLIPMAYDKEISIKCIEFIDETPF